MSRPSSPRTTVNTPTRDRTPSSNGIPIIHYSEPIKTTGERLASLVGASLTTVNDAIYVFGGFDQYTDEINNKLFKLDYKESCQWTQVIYTKGDPPAKRNDHSATLWNNDKLVIFGGNSEEDVYFNDIVVLDLNTMTWWHPQPHGFIPEGRIRHSATIHENKLYVAGGAFVGSSVRFADTLLTLDLTTWEWEVPIPFVTRVQHMSFVYNSRLYLFGGLREDMSRSNHLAFIDLNKTDRVTQLDISSPSAPSLAGQRFAQICGDQLIVLITVPFREATMLETATTGLWSLDLPSMQWQFKESGARYESCNWHCFSMAEHHTSFYLFGTNEEDPDEFFSMVLKVELEELGIVPVPPPQLGTDLISLLLGQQQKQNTDFAIYSLNEPQSAPIYVHRLVLYARWPHFVHLIESGMAESVSNSITMSEPKSTLESFVRYLYTDTLNDPSFTTELIADLMVMAHVYLLPRLLALSVRQLFKKMDIDHVSKIYHAATLSEQRGLQQASLQFIFRYFGAVSHTAGFRQLPISVLNQIWNDVPLDAAIVKQKHPLPHTQQELVSQYQTTVTAEDDMIENIQEDIEDDDMI
ncbi:Kelch domain-containing protein 3 [Choanephora cucurbitarum]|uniref:Kelch domain-containing protein 3 n=1 Tax=Choanephora cucurbitarum TaxID=101091 RepID=A0A1C7NHR3_9FUNG|nr:Kelch domain-containing protein 3 [Choanephora cucurbitarum]